MNDLVSIVIPVFNVERYLNECVDSVINQTYTNLEIILVDDGSTDKCSEICDNYQKKDSRIKVVHKKNGGLSDARNVGISIASGKYIAFVDSDDYIDLKMIEKLYEIIQKYNADISVCNYCLTSKKAKEYIDKRKSFVFEMDKKVYIENSYGYSSFGFAVWNKLYKKEIFDSIKFPVGKTSEDMYIFPEILEKTSHYAYTSEVCYYYRQRKGSISKGKIKYHGLLACSYNKRYIKKNFPTLYPNICAQHIYDCMGTYNKLIFSKKSKRKSVFFKKSIKLDLESIGKEKSKFFSKSKIIQIYVLLYLPFLYKIIFSMKKNERNYQFFD